MSEFVTGSFTFDEPPCYCKVVDAWQWGITEGTGLYIQCPACKVKTYVTNSKWRMGVRFSKEQKRYDKVDDCKIIPFRKI